jgi:hypothetical protein
MLVSKVEVKPVNLAASFESFATKPRDPRSSPGDAGRRFLGEGKLASG